MRDRLTLTCTDRGQHPACELAQIVWQPSNPEEGVVYDLDEAADSDLAIPMPSSTRSTASGNDRYVERREVRVVKRADGGRTFHFPMCPRCKKTTPPLRDQTVRTFRRWDGASLDVSLLNR